MSSLPILLILVMSISGCMSLYCTQSETYYAQCSRSGIAYTTTRTGYSCRVRLRRARCAKTYAVKGKTVHTYYPCPRYRTVSVCCPGWSGSSCNTHDRAPVKVYCPSNIAATSSLGQRTRYVTWRKPTFTEPYGYQLSITSTYGREGATLTFGSHTVSYTATSTNNNKQITCTFRITITPPQPMPVIQGYTERQRVALVEGQTKNIKCYSEYGNPVMTLNWFLNGQRISEGTSYSNKRSGYSVYRNSYNDLTMTFNRSHDEKLLECKGSQGSRTVSASIILDVDYDDPPELKYCPREQQLTTGSGEITARWGKPVFQDMKSEPLDIYTTYPGLNSSATSYVFGYGSHIVRYTALNRRSGLETSCEFTIKVKTQSCSSLSTPPHGALACGSWSDGSTRICTYMCGGQSDVRVIDDVFPVYICTTDGTWIPDPDPPQCSATRFPNKDRLPSPKHYFNGSCDTDEVKQNISIAALDIIKHSIVNATCKFEDCGLDKISVFC